MSKTILGAGGYLPQRQRNLEYLTIVTDLAYSDSRAKLDIRYYRKLKSLNWRGLRWYTDTASLNEQFDLKHEHLEQLTLDYGPWVTKLNTMRHWLQTVLVDGSSAVIHKLNQNLGFHHEESKFPSLKSLTLAAFQIVIPMQLKQELKLSQLRLLSLWNCLRTGDFLKVVVETGTVLKLATFELVRSYPRLDPREAVLEDQLSNYLPQFLLSFAGLENLYLLLATEDIWPSVIDAVSHHRASLKRLVLHYNILADMRSEEWFERIARDADIPGLSPLTGFSCVPGLQFLGLSNCLRPLVSYTVLRC